MLALILVYLCALYLSLPFGPHLARIANRILGSTRIKIFSYLSYLMILLAFIFVFFFMRSQGKKTKRNETCLFLGLLGFSCLFLHDLSLTPCERFHLMEYAILGIMVYFYFAQKERSPAFKAFVFLLLAAGLDEIFQALLPNRVGEMKDVMLNLIGGLWGILLARWFLALRKNKALIK